MRVIRKKTVELQFMTYQYRQRVTIEGVQGDQKGLYHHALEDLEGPKI